MSLTGARVRRSFAALSVTALVCGALAGLPIDPARATGTPTVSYAPAVPVTANMQIAVTVSGFPANAQVAVGQCPTGIVPKGPGDCGSPGVGASRLSRTDAAGALQTTLRVVVGPLGASLNPAAKCTSVDPCSIHVSTIGGVSVHASTPLLIAPSTPSTISLEASKSSVRQGKKVRFSGVVTPGALNGEVRVERKKAGGLWKLATLTDLDESEYSVTLRMKSRAWKSWRAVLPSSATAAGSVSKTVRVKVKPKR